MALIVHFVALVKVQYLCGLQGGVAHLARITHFWHTLQVLVWVCGMILILYTIALYALILLALQVFLNNLVKIIGTAL